MLKQLEIPRIYCDEKKREIEEDGLWEVLSCKPIEEKPDWCKLEYQLK